MRKKRKKGDGTVLNKYQILLFLNLIIFTLTLFLYKPLLLNKLSDVLGRNSLPLFSSYYNDLLINVQFIFIAFMRDNNSARIYLKTFENISIFLSKMCRLLLVFIWLLFYKYMTICSGLNIFYQNAFLQRCDGRNNFMQYFLN